ncbi:GyrI-like domain-containing protein [Cereibacter sphaeroides]|uniref:AraC family transcriptional regulator n=1 Tax=Rhodobacterales TaxID=204455 RepID=UPI000BBE1316|nr:MULTISPECIES: GyrI-like domain-containing protein [Paracoccaceae]MCE6959501.1 GyrI-like domain-containing protein [Cereibacter sphaeroides]MCE6968226.1 GyrI-like domain-containing protein [Cereibacter sphaeroides]MCE6973728.1 GyrI-like domain-containing protein [Cereibacter sphaeroides]
MYPVQIRDKAPRRLAALLHAGSFEEIGCTLGQTCQILEERGLLDRAGCMVGVYWDNPVLAPAGTLHSHAGIDVPAGMDIAAPLQELRLSGGRHAVLRYTGPYSGLADAYRYLFTRWLPENRETQAEGPVLEIYRNASMDTPSDQLVTDICVPLT